MVSIQVDISLKLKISFLEEFANKNENIYHENFFLI